MPQDFDSLFREAMSHFTSHVQFLRRRGYNLDVEGREAVATRRDEAVSVRFPLAVLKDRHGLSRLGF